MNHSQFTDDTIEFIRKWENHIDELEGLRWNLHPDDYGELEEHQEALKELVGKASESIE